MGKIGLTSTIPVEVIFAAGHVPVDLNNIFITDSNPSLLVKEAEENGLPRNLCSWVKGIYSTVLRNPDIESVVAVTEGDCANTLAMLDLLSDRGVEIITFAYPFNRDPEVLDHSISRLEKQFGVSREQTMFWKTKLDEIRKIAHHTDDITWRENLIDGFENHLTLISCSDFEGNPDLFRDKIENLKQRALKRKPADFRIRLGYCGVPTIFSDLYQYLESLGARVVFNEVQRQFAMPGISDNIVDQYLNYTYPYSYKFRIEDMNKELKKRKIDGLINYMQSFCHHQIHDQALKEGVSVPTLTLEGDKPGPLLERNKIRIESFIEMLNL